MRIATGNIGHESSTFTPIETPYEAFSEASRGFHRGPELIEAMRETNTGCGGFIDAAATHGYELVPSPVDLRRTLRTRSRRCLDPPQVRVPGATGSRHAGRRRVAGLARRHGH